jgi:hypothetical protein
MASVRRASAAASALLLSSSALAASCARWRRWRPDDGTRAETARLHAHHALQNRVQAVGRRRELGGAELDGHGALRTAQPRVRAMYARHRTSGSSTPPRESGSAYISIIRTLICESTTTQAPPRSVAPAHVREEATAAAVGMRVLTRRKVHKHRATHAAQAVDDERAELEHHLQHVAHATREAAPVGQNHQRQLLSPRVADGLRRLERRVGVPHLMRSEAGAGTWVRSQRPVRTVRAQTWPARRKTCSLLSATAGSGGMVSSSERVSTATTPTCAWAVREQGADERGRAPGCLRGAHVRRPLGVPTRP